MLKESLHGDNPQETKMSFCFFLDPQRLYVKQSRKHIKHKKCL